MAYPPGTRLKFKPPYDSNIDVVWVVKDYNSTSAEYFLEVEATGTQAFVPEYTVVVMLMEAEAIASAISLGVWRLDERLLNSRHSDLNERFSFKAGYTAAFKGKPKEANKWVQGPYHEGYAKGLVDAKAIST